MCRGNESEGLNGGGRSARRWLHSDLVKPNLCRTNNSSASSRVVNASKCTDRLGVGDSAFQTWRQLYRPPWALYIYRFGHLAGVYVFVGPHLRSPRRLSRNRCRAAPVARSLARTWWSSATGEGTSPSIRCTPTPPRLGGTTRPRSRRKTLAPGASEGGEGPGGKRNERTRDPGLRVRRKK